MGHVLLYYSLFASTSETYVGHHVYDSIWLKLRKPNHIL